MSWITSRQELNVIPIQRRSFLEMRPLTYKELDERSNKLANHLLNTEYYDTNPRYVILCLDRSLEMSVGILGILKANLAYVPVDASFPKDRIEYIVKDTQAASVVTTSKHAKLFVNQSIQAICLDTFGDETSDDTILPAVSIDSEDTAYVIYTSGTTGVPKGVPNSHKGLLNRLLWMQEDIQVIAEDIILQKTPYTFDVSVWELLLPLMMGGKLVFAEPDGHMDTVYLKQLIEKESISILHFVPSMLSLFLECPIRKNLTSIRQVICSGEALPLRTVTQFHKELSHTEITNYYGPTEAAIDVTAINLSRYKERDVRIPIGCPVNNTKIYIVDGLNRPQPIGIAGELLIGGVQVAQGYLNREELTKDRFVTNPFDQTTNVYRTGDVAKWLSDGTIEYLGRRDSQVKIRGFRIELEEIENVIVEKSEKYQAAVVDIATLAGEKVLVAYIVSNAGFDKNDLQQYLSQKLPHYMVPVIYKEIEAVPLSRNGKLDRKLLPKIETTDIQGGEQIVAPKNEIEEALNTLWEELLQMQEISTEASFFDLGGSSLSAMKLVGKIRERFGVEIALKSIFENPTIASLALLVSTQEIKTDAKITAIERPEHIPASFTQERLWIIDQLNGSIEYHLPALFSISGVLDLQALEESLQEILRRHEALRTVFYQKEAKVYQKIISHENFTLNQLPADVIAEGEISDEVISNLLSIPFDISSDYMLRTGYYCQGEDQHLILLEMHHIASDGWSISLLVRELEVLYASNISGKVSELNPLPLQYADYSVWQRNTLQGPNFEEKLGLLGV